MIQALCLVLAILLLIAFWFLWTFLKVYFQTKALARIEREVNIIGKRPTELSCASPDLPEVVIRDLVSTGLVSPDPYHAETEIYKDLVQKCSIQELWARVGTRINIGRKPNSRDSELVGRFMRLISEIEFLIRNDFTSRRVAQLGDWDDEKTALIRDFGVRQRASVAAIDQLVADIERELRV